MPYEFTEVNNTEKGPVLGTGYEFTPVDTHDTPTDVAFNRAHYYDTSHLDTNIPYGYDINEIRALNQSIGEKWLYGGVKAGVTAVSAVGTTIGAIGGAAVAGTLAALGDPFDADIVFKNPVINALNAFKDEVALRNPHYKTQEEIGESVFANMTKANFWSDQFLDGVGFLASAVLTGAGVANIGVKAGIANLGKYAAGVNEFAAAAIGRVGESVIEANDAYDKTADLLRQRRRDGEINLSDEQIDERAKGARAATFGLNMALSIPDAYQLGKVLKWKGKVPNKSIFGHSRLAHIAEQTIIESQEENFQLAVSNMAADFANKTISAQDNLNALDYIDGMVSGMVNNFATKEGQESMLLGGLLGGGMGAIIGNPNRRTQVTADDLDNAVPEQIKKQRSLLRLINSNVKLDKIKEEALKRNQPWIADLANELSLAGIVYHRLENNEGEKLANDIATYEKMPIDEFNKLDGYEEISEETKTQKLAEIKTAIEQYKELYNLSKDPSILEKHSGPLHPAIQSNMFFLSAHKANLLEQIDAIKPYETQLRSIENPKDAVKIGASFVRPETELKKLDDLRSKYNKAVKDYNDIITSPAIRENIIKDWEENTKKPTKPSPQPEGDENTEDAPRHPKGQIFQLAGQPSANYEVLKSNLNDDGSTTITAKDLNGTEYTFNTKKQAEIGAAVIPTRAPETIKYTPGSRQAVRPNLYSTLETLGISKETNKEGYDALVNLLNSDPDYKDKISFKVRRVPNRSKVDVRIKAGRLGNVYSGFSPDILLIPATTLEFVTVIQTESGPVEFQHFLADPNKFTDKKGNPIIFDKLSYEEAKSLFKISNTDTLTEDQYNQLAREQKELLKFYEELWALTQEGNSYIDIPSNLLDYTAIKGQYAHIPKGEPWVSPSNYEYLHNEQGNMVVVDLTTNTDVLTNEDYSDQLPENILEQAGYRKYVAKVFHPTLKGLWVRVAPKALVKSSELLSSINEFIRKPNKNNIANLNERLFIASEAGWNFRFDYRQKKLHLDAFNKELGKEFKDIAFSTPIASLQEIINVVNEKAGIELTKDSFKEYQPRTFSTNEELENSIAVNVKEQIVTSVDLQFKFNQAPEKTSYTDFRTIKESTPQQLDWEEEARKELENPDSSNDVLFKREGSSAKNPIDYEGAVKWLKANLPDAIEVLNLDTVTKNINYLKTTWGAFSGNIVYLSNYAGEGTQYHEAFHAVFNVILDSKERAKLYEVARQKYGIKSDMELEEAMADDFMDWKNKRSRKSVGLIQSIYQRILDWFKFITNNRDQVDALFAKIDSGAFSNKTIINNNSPVSPVYKLLKGTSVVRMEAESSRRVIFSTAAYVLKQISIEEDTIGAEEKIQSLTNTFLDNLAAKYDPNGKEDIDVELGRTLAHLKMIYTDPQNRALIAAEVYNILKIYNIQDSILEREEATDEEDEPERTYDVHQGELGGWKNISKAIKQFIALTTVEETDEYGVTYERAVDFQNVYTALQRRLAGLTTEAQMLNEFKRFASLSNEPHIKAVYDKFVRETGYTGDPETVSDPNLFKRFLITFKLEPIDYLQVIKRKNPDTNLVELVSFSANRNSPGAILFNRWSIVGRQKDIFRNTRDASKILSALATAAGVFKSTKTEITSEDIQKVMTPLHQLGIDVSEGYVKESLESAHGLLGVDPIARYLTGEDLQLFQTIIKRGGRLFEKNINPETGEFIDTSGAITTLTNIAEGDVKFRSDVYETTFQDAEGKNRYGYVLPSMMLTKVRELSNFSDLDIKKLQQDEFHQYNPFLHMSNVGNIFRNMAAVFAGDYRDDVADEDGKTFKHADQKSLLLSVHGAAKSNIYTPMIYEAKSTSIAVKLPTQEYVGKDGRIKAETVDLIYDTLFVQEHQRINRKILKDSNYNNSKKPWLNLPYFNNVTTHYSEMSLEEIQSNPQTVKEIKGHIADMLKFEIAEHLKSLNTYSIKLDAPNLEQYVGNFVINDFVNSIAISQLIHGDLSKSKKGDPEAVYTDLVKRNAGVIAYGPHAGDGNYKVVYKTEQYDEDGNNTDDAQVWVSGRRRLDLMRRFGKLDDVLEKILTKAVNGQPLTAEEISKIDMIPMKTVHYDGDVYHKMSEAVLLRSLVSKPKEVNGVMTWVAQEGKEVLHNMLEFMEKHQVDAIVTDSASKLSHGKTSDGRIAQSINSEDLLNGVTPELPDIAEVQNRSIRLQLENNSGKRAIISGTQMAQLIDLGYFDEEIKKEYQYLMAGTRLEDYHRASVIGQNPSLLQKKLLGGLEASAEDAQLIDMLELNSEGKFKWNFNLPHVSDKFESIFLSHYFKGTTQQKVPGYKLTLMSSYGIKIKDPKTGELRSLKMHRLENGKIELAEVMMTRGALSEILGPFANTAKIEDINEALLQMVGTRIPTQAHHSMMPFKVVQFLPEEYKDTIIAPAGITGLSGADYDIDSLYVYRKDFYKNSKGETVVYSRNRTDEELWEDYKYYHLHNKEVKRFKLDYKAEGKTEEDLMDDLHLATSFEEFLGLSPEQKITNGVRNNELVDIYLKVLTDPSVEDLFIPVNAEAPFKDAVKALYNVAKQDEASKELSSITKNYFSINGKLRAHEAVSAGKQNIGPAAASNSVSAFATKSGLKLKEAITLFGKKYFDYGVLQEDDITFETRRGKTYIGKSVTKSKIDSQSTVVSAMTDDAKFGFSFKLNLKPYNLGALMNMISLGVGFNRSLLVMSQPIMQKLTHAVVIEGKDAKKALKDLIDPNVKYNSQITEQDLLNRLQGEENPEVDLYVLETFASFLEAADNFRTISLGLGLNKGNSKIITVNDLQTRMISLNKIVNQFTDEESSPYVNFSDVLATNKNLSTNIDITHDIYNQLSTFFMSANPQYNNYYGQFASILKTRLTKVSRAQAKRDFKSLVTIKQFKDYLEQQGHKVNYESLLGLIDPDLGTSLAQQISSYSDTDVKFKNNEFVKLLNVQLKYTDGRINKNNADKVDKVFTDSRTRMSPLVLDKVRNGYLELLANPEYYNFAKNAFRYTLINDSFQFRNGSMIKFIDINQFLPVSDALNQPLELFESDLIEMAKVFAGYKFNNNLLVSMSPIKLKESNGTIGVKSITFNQNEGEELDIPYAFVYGQARQVYVKESPGGNRWVTLETFGKQSVKPYGLTYEQNLRYENQVAVETQRVDTPSEILNTSNFTNFNTMPTSEDEGEFTNFNVQPKTDETGFTNFNNITPKESRLDSNSTETSIISYNFHQAILRLSKRFNIPVELIDLPDVNWRGRYVSGRVELNLAKLREDTPFHEFAHPFIEMVRTSNVKLYDSLVKEVLAEKKTLQKITQLYPELDRAGRLEEAIVTLIGNYAGQEASMPKTLVQKIKDFLREIARYINTLLGREALVSELNPNTTLKELGSLMAKGSENYRLSDLNSEQEYYQKSNAVKLTVDSNHVYDVRLGKKILSLRDPLGVDEGIEYKQGDILTVFANSQNQGIRVLVKDVRTIDKLKESSRDKVAQALGYTNYDTLIASNDYNHAESKASRNNPNVYKFLQGELAQQLITYEVIEEFNPETESKADSLISKLQVAITKQIMRFEEVITRRSKNNEKVQGFLDKQNKLLRGLGAVSNAQGLKDFISNAKLDLTENRDKLKKKIGNITNLQSLSEEDRHSIIALIESSRDFLNTYATLFDSKEVSANVVEDIVKESEVRDEYTEVKGLYDDIKQLIDSKAISLIANWLLDYRDVTPEEVEDYFKQRQERIEKSNASDSKKARLISELLQNKEKYLITQESLEQMLRIANKNSSWGEYFLGAAISSSDTVTALFAKALKVESEQARLEDKKLQETLGAALAKYEQVYGKSNKPEEFYAKFFTTVKKYIGQEDGSPVLEEVLVFKNSIEDDVVANELLQEMLVAYKSALEELPKSQYQNIVFAPYGTNQEVFSLPFIRISGLDRLRSDGIVEYLKADLEEIYKPLATDTEYGYNENGKNFVPVFYTYRGSGERRMSNSDISKDLVGSILKFSQMANKYSAYKRIQAEVSLFESIVEERGIKELDSRGRPIIDRIAAQFGKKDFMKTSSNRVNERLQAFINMEYYGIREKPWVVTKTVLGKEYEIDINKLFNFLGRWTGLNTLALNLLSAVNNVALGNFYIFQESLARQNFGFNFELRKGKAIYYKAAPTMFADIGKIHGLSKETQLAREYDAIQGEFSDISGHFITGSKLKKMWGTSALFFLNHAGEHEMQISTLFAALQGQKVKTKSGEEISLWEAYELDEKGLLKIKDGVEWSEKDRMTFMNKLHATNKALHGNYNDFDRTVLQGNAIGRLIIMFRKFMAPGVRRRFGHLTIDHELNEMHEGFFRTSWRILTQETGELRDWLMFKQNNLTQVERANLRRTVIELGTWLTAMTAFAIVSGAMDDDDDSWFGNLALYELRRFQTELGFYIDFSEALKIAKSPAATISTVQRFYKIGNMLTHTMIGDSDYTHYQVSGHGHKKGDSKLWSSIKDVAPALHAIENAAHPEESIKYFDKLF